MTRPTCPLAACLFALMLTPALAGDDGPATSYDPLALTDARLPEPVDLTLTDEARDREIPIRVYPPAGAGPAPVILFSHGLGGSRTGSAYLGRHWAARGYAAVFLQHPGSDESVWKDEPPSRRMAALKRAANLENSLARFRDVPAALDQLEQLDRRPEGPLAGRLDLGKVGMSGHSFGAVTTQAVSGQATPMGAASFTDPRIKAALIQSPSGPRRGDARRAFSKVAIPWMLMTGTEDTSPIGEVDVKSRLSVFPALPSGHKYELVLDRAEHSAFTDRALPGDRRPRNPNHHRAILALSTAFWDAYLRDDPAAKAWLDGDGPRGVLEPKDRWQAK